jgi:hypothetical protein
MCEYKRNYFKHSTSIMDTENFIQILCYTELNNVFVISYCHLKRKSCKSTELFPIEISCEIKISVPHSGVIEDSGLQGRHTLLLGH